MHKQPALQDRFLSYKMQSNLPKERRREKEDRKGAKGENGKRRNEYTKAGRGSKEATAFMDVLPVTSRN